MATLTVMLPHIELQEAPSAPLALYAVDENLAALVDTEASVPEEQRPAFAQQFQMAIRTSPDGVAQSLAFIDSQIELAKAECRRIWQRQADFEFLRESLTMHAVQAIQALGADRKGKYPKIEGQLFTLSVRANPDSVNVTDPAKVPDSYKRISVRLPLRLWNSVLDSVDIDLAQKITESAGRPDVEVSKSAVKDALATGAAIDGAGMVRTYRLEVK